MKKCPKCGYIRQETDQCPEYECPHCGIIYQKYHSPKVEKTRKRGAKIAGKEQKSKKPSLRIGRIALIASGTLLAVFLITFFALPPSPQEIATQRAAESQKQKERNQEEAFTLCKREVMRNLSDPFSADFPLTWQKGFLMGDSLYIIQSYVDSKNAAGLPVRTSWECQIRNSGEEWQVEKILFQ